MKKSNIVLIGFRGSGKSHFGRALAHLNNLPFADIDEEIEFLIEEPLLDFVEKHGWQVFREIEQRVAHDLCRNFSGILSTGDGTIENSKNLQNLKKTGTFAWLNPDFKDVRSFLLGSEKEKKRMRINPSLSLAQEIDQMWQQRKGIYQAIAEIELTPDLKGDSSLEAKKLVTTLQSLLPSAPSKKRIAVFASQAGTTFQGLLDAQKRGRIPNVEFTVFVTDKPDCEALEKAKKAGITNIEVVEPRDGESQEEYDRALINILREHNPDFVLLLGWMRILSPLYCEQFGTTTLNVYPSLLPKFAGLADTEVHQKVLEYEERYTGCTIHRITAQIDAGEAVLQRKVLVEKGDTVQSLKKKVQKQEILGFCEFLERR